MPDRSVTSGLFDFRPSISNPAIDTHPFRPALLHVTRPRDDTMHDDRKNRIHESREYNQHGKVTVLDDELNFV